MNEDKKILLKVIVGSQAHGLATPDSDYDYRGVFVVNTRDVLSIGGHCSSTTWIEGSEDDTAWEIGKFLQMATKCNPTVLETFLAPIKETTPYGDKIRDIFPYVWNSTDVMNAYIGYGLNQRKKFLDDKDKQRNKYATAYLRTLYNAYELLNQGSFSVDMRHTEIFETLKRFKIGEYEVGEVITISMEWETKVKQAYDKHPDKKTDINRINKLLHEVRYFYW